MAYKYYKLHLSAKEWLKLFANIQVEDMHFEVPLGVYHVFNSNLCLVSQKDKMEDIPKFDKEETSCIVESTSLEDPYVELWFKLPKDKTIDIIKVFNVTIDYYEPILNFIIKELYMMQFIGQELLEKLNQKY